MSQKRQSIHAYFMTIAMAVKTRSTCRRREVGAVVVRHRHILSTGYNGPPSRVPHCTVEPGPYQCYRIAKGVKSGDRLDLCRAVHAEMNALLQAARNGVSVLGGTLYTTNTPCILCAGAIINAGVINIYAGEPYPSECETLFKDARVNLSWISLSSQSGTVQEVDLPGDR